MEVVVPSTLATPDTRRAAERAVKAIAVRGCTDLCGGWLHGCEQVGLELGEDTVGRCLLLTDGIANEGITDHGEHGQSVLACDRHDAANDLAVEAGVVQVPLAGDHEVGIVEVAPADERDGMPAGERVEVDGLRLSVEQVSNRRIRLVRARRIFAEGEPDGN